jgi:hypothetical protein
MTAEEQGEFVRMVRALDMAVRTVAGPLWSLCLPALHLMQEHDRGRRMRPCPMPQCRLVSGHRCGCDVRSVRRGLACR